MTCPLCDVPCDDADPETGEPKCPECRRVWYPSADGSGWLCRGRTALQILTGIIHCPAPEPKP